MQPTAAIVQRLVWRPAGAGSDTHSMLTMTRVVLLLMTQLAVVLVTVFSPLGRIAVRTESRPLVAAETHRARGASGPMAFEVRFGHERVLFRIGKREPL